MRFFTFALFTAILTLSILPHCSADTVTLTGPGIPSSVILDNTLPDPIIPGQSFTAPLMPYSNTFFSVGGMPSFTVRNIAVGGGFGVVSESGQVTITDKTGGAMQITIDFDEGYTHLSPALYGGLLVGSFKEPGAPAFGRNDNVNVLISSLGNQGMVSAFDSNGFAFANFSNVMLSGGGSPVVDVFVTFTFGQNSPAGDSISIPINVGLESSIVPEPSSTRLLGLALLAAIGFGFASKKKYRRDARVR